VIQSRKEAQLNLCCVTIVHLYDPSELSDMALPHMIPQSISSWNYYYFFK